MRRLLTAALMAIALVVLVILGTAADDGPTGYRVRAVFDSAANAVPGEDVKIAGAKVGVIDSMEVTDDKKAAVTLRIDDGRFAPFRADASCTIRPQSLIGEKFVECKPGTAKAAELPKITRGDGSGQHLLALGRNSSPVDLDLVNDIARRPYRERLAILLNEFGTGLAGRDGDLRDVIHRANPALRETDRALAILARQNRTLASLARNSDTALAPLAKRRRNVSGFIVAANKTAAATAARRTDIEAGIQRLPEFLRQLRPLMADLDGFAAQATPVARDLNSAAPSLSKALQRLGPFSTAATPSLVSLGKATARGRPALLRTRPLIRDLASFASDARPVSANLDTLTKSLDTTGAIPRLMDFIYYSALSINGFDDIGHYLRAALLVNLCTQYSTEVSGGCESTFSETQAISSSAGSASAVSAGNDATAVGDSATPAPQGGLVGDVLEGGVAKPDAKAPTAKQPASDGADPALDFLLGADK